MKKNYVGTWSLAISFGGWLVLHLQPWLTNTVAMWPPSHYHLLDAFFSAALVGSLADWFAVTALFKKPLGLSLPHVDVLRRRKDDVARAVPQFLAGLMTPEALAPELRRLDYLRALEAGFSQLRRHFDAVSVASRLVEVALRQGWDQSLWTAGSRVLATTLKKNRGDLVEYLTAVIKKNAGWQGLFVGTGTVDRLFQGALGELSSLEINGQHPLRTHLSESLERWSREIQETNSESRIQLDKAIKTLESDPKFKATWLRLLGQAICWMRRSEVPENEADEELRQRVNNSLGDLVVQLMGRTQVLTRAASALGDFLAKMDAEVFVQQAEKAVWNDLQYIRVNGAIVGGLVGLALALFSSLVGIRL